MRRQTPVCASSCITGAGPVFCSGADLSERGAAAPNRMPDILTCIVESSVPFIARVNGHARAGGLGLIAACDLAAAAESSTFAFTEVRVGVAPAMILVPALRVVEPRFLASMVLTGERFDARRAASAGLLSAVTEDEAALDAWVGGTGAGHRAIRPRSGGGHQGSAADAARPGVGRRVDRGRRHVGRALRRPRGGGGNGGLPAEAPPIVGPDTVSTPIRSHLATDGGEFKGNAEAMRALTDEVRALHDEVLAGGGPQYVERHRGRGKMMVRERLEALVDPGTPVLELCPLAGLHTGDPVGGGVVVALAEVAHTQCLVVANDPTVRGGTTSPTTIRKLLRAMDVAEENRLPLLLLVESGGADLPRQADVFVPGGEQFRRLTQLSAQGIPTICVVFGSSTAGGAYLPGMSDYTVMVEDRARVFLGGPPLVKMAIGEEADEEELGGALMHARTSGLCDYLARDEEEALRIARGIVAHLHWRRLGPGPDGPADQPLYPADELLGIASVDVRVPFDVREILARVVDGSRFEEFKESYGPQLVCGWASVAGYPVGVLGNNGILFSPEAQKGAQFIALCNRTDTPILFVQNITGFMVGTRYEQGGIIKDGAKLINAVSNSTVPHLTLMVGASYGAGNYAMAGRAYDPRFVFTWPNHRIAVMGPKQLAGVLSIVRRNAAEAAGRPFDEAADEELRQATESQIEEESTAQYATGRLWDDGIIDPRETRTVLAIALTAAHSAAVQGTAVFGVVRH